ncbi:MAG TPA: tyrosine-type recombinase/integrase [Solirubrobacteraceae bacterium]|jgi:integrase
MAAQIRETAEPGILRTHARGCPGGKCKCAARYQAWVYDSREKRVYRKSFDTQKEAKLWRSEQLSALAAGTVRAPSKRTFKEAADALLAGIKDGTIENRSGRRYKPATVRRYELALDKHLRPKLNKLKLSQIDRRRVKALVAEWKRDGMTAPSSIRNNLDPLRVIVREAIEDGAIAIDPLAGLRLPQGGGRRERVADRAEAQKLIDALDQNDRALWACAFYGTLRRGELRALRWTDIDFEAGCIHVMRGWDDIEGEQETKTDAGARDVPLAGILRKLLAAHKLATGRGSDDLVFGRTATEPFTASTIGLRAQKRWKAAGLEPITLHEARHSAASYLIEAGLNDLELTAMVGHSDSRTTKNIYGHLFPDSGVKVAAKLDEYLAAESV